jgi:uncharacterized protein (TIRG00374 family)
MASKLNSRLSLILKITVAVGLITFMVRSGHLDPKVLWNLLTPRNIAVAVLLTGLNTLAAAWRWIVLLKARGFYIPFIYGVSLYLIGIFFNYALPGAVSGDLVRGYYLVRDYPNHRLDAVLSILIDRILGLYSFFILSLIAVAVDFKFVMGHEQIRWLALLCFLIFAAVTVFFLISFSARLYRFSRFEWLARKVPRLHQLMEGFQRFGRDRGIIALSVLSSLVAQGLSMAFFYYIAVITGETSVTWSAILFAVPMGFLVTALPIAPAGVGVGQVAFLYLFRAYLGHPTQFGATAITAFQLTTVVWVLVGAVLYIRRRKPHEIDLIQGEMEPTGS